MQHFKSWEEEAERKAVLGAYRVTTGALCLNLVAHCDS